MSVVKSLLPSQVAHQAGGYPGLERLGVFLFPPGWDASPSQFAGTHLYILVKRGTVRVKSLAVEHNAVPQPGAQTPSVRSGVQRTNH